MMLSSELTKWVLLANVLAWPIAYYAMHRWLQNFANRASLEFWIFLWAGALAFFIALITVSYQAIRAAVSDPVKSLKYE